MAPEHEARARVLYDHESEETGRRRHAVADWGVGEDIFDRMPSRRFTRAERRAAHSGTVVISREPETVHVEVDPGEEPWAEPRSPARAAAEPEPRREREIESWGDDGSWSEPQPRRAGPGLAEPRRAAPVAAESRRAAPAPVESRPADSEFAEWHRAELAPVESHRAEPAFTESRRAAPAAAEPGSARLGLVEPPARLVAASSRAPARTVVAAREEAPEHELPVRRTVVISGHPGGLPSVRPARPPKTALERVGTRPDRIVAYAVALGFLLVLIAVLTTGQ